jgi:hypothetical protein
VLNIRTIDPGRGQREQRHTSGVPQAYAPLHTVPNTKTERHYECQTMPSGIATATDALSMPTMSARPSRRHFGKVNTEARHRRPPPLHQRAETARP